MSAESSQTSDSQPMDSNSTDIDRLAQQLVQHLRGYESCVVAFSGGVDSAVVAQAAQLALGDRAQAVTAQSPSLATGELQLAQQVAEQIGIRHRVIHTHEFANPNYIANEADRCYHCKTELYQVLISLEAEYPNQSLVNGANLDDLGDYRPGLQAAREHQVRSPLAECGLNKQAVRALAKHWNLSVWDKPAMPCLSSRVAYGLAVTPERLRMIDGAEVMLRQLGFPQVRVRLHADNLGRIEVPTDQLARLLAADLQATITRQMLELGFQFITVDLQGFRSGNLNTLIPVETLQAVKR